MNRTIIYDKNQTKNAFNDYKNFLLAVSQGKLLLLDDVEITQYASEGFIIAEQSIDKPEDVVTCRKMVENILLVYSEGSQNIHRVMVAVSEAATNVLKHAGSGQFTVLLNGNVLKLMLKDRGEGIPLDKIPQIVFVGGYSTKASLGFGLSVMYRLTDKLILYSSNTGTTVIMEKTLENHPIDKQGDWQ